MRNIKDLDLRDDKSGDDIAVFFMDEFGDIQDTVKECQPFAVAYRIIDSPLYVGTMDQWRRSICHRAKALLGNKYPSA